ncbi:MAG: Ribosome-recycling factor [Candidatus Magasanikbacteria bacterium GW2011_GWA2_37_8]|uniref:Ribosome-recycling factor n=1 Tax=Candidatus Magasanikbacteria bacterium GW2011_GWA2_37_8 TaxID=1619036 RepID=A0A0G0HCN1_9BACT|nr:MAG: Ribosome-recycling factor [Candidatus Magasanikbacteria bacterium GW2011_GWA2_37_8]
MNINDFKIDFDKVIEFLKTDISGLRTGRASAAMVEGISVDAYGTHQPLKAVASITISDAKTLMIDPWDKSLLGAVEKGIRDSNIGLNPVNDGRGIRLILPELTVERRQELIKVLHQRLENARISVRKVREEIRDTIAGEEKEGNIGEDEKFKLQEDLDKMVKDYNEKIKGVGDDKEEEINTI